MVPLPPVPGLGFPPPLPPPRPPAIAGPATSATIATSAIAMNVFLIESSVPFRRTETPSRLLPCFGYRPAKRPNLSRFPPYPAPRTQDPGRANIQESLGFEGRTGSFAVWEISRDVLIPRPN